MFQAKVSAPALTHTDSAGIINPASSSLSYLVEDQNIVQRMRTLGVHKPPPKENILITLEVYTLITSISLPALLILFIFGGAFSGVRSASST